jgi:phosphoglucosamine mutase
MRADAGVVISASHNPYQDNGIKIFCRDGFKLPDVEENEIERLVTSGEIDDIRPAAMEIGKAKRIDDAMGRYIVFCKDTFPDELSLEGTKIVVDCANGATYKVAPIVLSELGAEVTALHCEPNGTNINENCGALYTDDLSARVRAMKADIGLAFDGDGDRLIAVDENGKTITGDHVLAICSKFYKEMGFLDNNLVVTTVMSNFGLGVVLRKMGIDTSVADVGDRYVLEMMKEKGAKLGGEASGHVIFLNHHTTGDGIVTALQLLAAMKARGQTLSELAKIMTSLPQKTLNIEVSSKPPLEEIAGLQVAIREAEAELSGQGRLLVRYSGTQSLCRVMVEGPSQSVIDRICASLAVIVSDQIG